MAVSVLLGYWIHADATARGSDSALSWAIGSVATLLGTVAYFLYRHKIGGRSEPASRRERIAGTVVFAQLFALVLGAKLSPPDPFTQLLQLPPLVVVGLLPAYWLVWRGGYARLRRRIGLVHDDEQRH
ncbi:DUF7534 family protein [Halocatena salina]|uniref:Uncharacterized protein n=1 Tax=Halocatena salina TaxID=2934340 RepID=A0A8T9ZZ64_9EURY|nr:hypothetical protein [Halocatena salina]UPM41746.1 hypothetical protein MW046_07030 [Halocatena salina]